ncbi:DUF4192 family protein [Corynebacterium sp. AOP12-C2-36]|uniref:DUF4192 family protein n=1 Tax=Corynebacterium sp. AOP12-C2-36 TaxID=3457723 RepID=UPI004033451C
MHDLDCVDNDLLLALGSSLPGVLGFIPTHHLILVYVQGPSDPVLPIGLRITRGITADAVVEVTDHVARSFSASGSPLRRTLAIAATSDKQEAMRVSEVVELVADLITVPMHQTWSASLGSGEALHLRLPGGRWSPIGTLANVLTTAAAHTHMASGRSLHRSSERGSRLPEPAEIPQTAFWK